jgi:hypothetical protein
VTKKNHEKPQLGQLVSRPIFGLGSTNHSAVMFSIYDRMEGIKTLHKHSEMKYNNYSSNIPDGQYFTKNTFQSHEHDGAHAFLSITANHQSSTKYSKYTYPSIYELPICKFSLQPTMKIYTHFSIYEH